MAEGSVEFSSSSDDDELEYVSALDQPKSSFAALLACHSGRFGALGCRSVCHPMCGALEKRAGSGCLGALQKGCPRYLWALLPSHSTLTYRFFMVRSRYQMDAEFEFPSKMVAAFRQKVEVAEADCAPYMAVARKYHARFESRLDYEAEQFIKPLEAEYDRRVQPYVDKAVAKVDAKLEERRHRQAEKREAERKAAAALELEEMRSGTYKFYIDKDLEDSDRLHAAATLINAGVRGLIGRRQFAAARMQADQDELMRAVRTCQRCVRRVIYLHVTRPDRMATVLQAHWRGYRTRAWWTTWKPKQILERRNAAATKIQGAYRGLIKRREFSFAIFGAKQEALSQGLLTKTARKSRTLESLPRWKKDTEAATRIQRMLRARKNRSSMMSGLKRKMRRDAAKARTTAVMESEAAELLVAQQGGEVTVLQGTGPASSHHSLSHLY
jgi:hypothetical protein